MASMNIYKCCICGREFEDYSGCNPWPVVVDDEDGEVRSVCCHYCDCTVVIPARLRMAREAESNN